MSICLLLTMLTVIFFSTDEGHIGRKARRKPEEIRRTDGATRARHAGYPAQNRVFCDLRRLKSVLFPVSPNLYPFPVDFFVVITPFSYPFNHNLSTCLCNTSPLPYSLILVLSTHVQNRAQKTACLFTGASQHAFFSPKSRPFQMEISVSTALLLLSNKYFVINISCSHFETCFGPSPPVYRSNLPSSCQGDRLEMFRLTARLLSGSQYRKILTADNADVFLKEVSSRLNQVSVLNLKVYLPFILEKLIEIRIVGTNGTVSSQWRQLELLGTDQQGSESSYGAKK